MSKKSLYLHVTPKFAQLKGQFVNRDEKHQAERRLLLSHVLQHTKTIKELSEHYAVISNQLRGIVGPLLFSILLKRIDKFHRKRRLESFQTKNKKLRNLRPPVEYRNYEIPVVNLSSKELTRKEIQQLSFGLDHCFVDKNKYVKQNLAANMEVLAEKLNKNVPNTEKENFHEFLRGYTDIFTKNIYKAKDDTYKNLKKVTNDPDLVVISGDKDSSVVVMNKEDYVRKMTEMIDQGISDGVYEETTDETLDDLKHFQDFLYRNFKKFEKYEKMYPSSHQPAKLYGTAKTHKFESIQQITLENLKFRPIIAQTGTCLYSSAQVISEYLKPLYTNNEYIISNTQDFADIIRSQPKLQDNEEYISYDVESLFTNVPIQDTIDFIISEIYTNQKLKPICTKLIMKRLLLKLSSESTFMFQSKFYKQKAVLWVDPCQ